MKYWHKCLQPDTKPNAIFNKDGIWPAYEYHYSLFEVDRNKRKEEIEEIVRFGKKIHTQVMTVLLVSPVEKVYSYCFLSSLQLYNVLVETKNFEPRSYC